MDLLPEGYTQPHNLVEPVPTLVQYSDPEMELLQYQLRSHIKIEKSM